MAKVLVFIFSKTESFRFRYVGNYLIVLFFFLLFHILNVNFEVFRFQKFRFSCVCDTFRLLYVSYMA